MVVLFPARVKISGSGLRFASGKKGQIKKTVLIVNDEQAGRDAVRKALSETGHVLLEARDGTECISLARKHRPDLIILDIVMPGPDGYTTLARLKSDDRLAAIPVIIYPLGKGKIYHRIAVELGASGFLSPAAGAAQIKKKAEMVLASA
jgi:CheY-like chemotaxis protein